jgi:hypothetical protein
MKECVKSHSKKYLFCFVFFTVAGGLLWKVLWCSERIIRWWQPAKVDNEHLIFVLVVDPVHIPGFHNALSMIKIQYLSHSFHTNTSSYV